MDDREQAVAVLAAPMAMAIVAGLLISRRFVEGGNPFLPTLLPGLHRDRAGLWRRRST